MILASLLLSLLLPGRAQSPPAGLPDDRSVLAEVEAFDRQIAAIDARIVQADVEIHAAQGALAGHTRDLEETRAAIVRARPGTQALLRTWYKLARGGMARLLFSAEDPAELRRRAYYLTSLLGRQKTRITAYTGMMQRRSEAESDAQAAAAQVQALREDLDAERTKLETERKSRMELLRSLRANRSLSARMAEELARVDVAPPPAEAAPPASPTPAPDVNAANAAFRAAKGRLPRPVQGPVLHAYGARTDAPTPNTGVDLSAPAGTTFRAVFDGTVTRSGYVRGYGQVVVVAHGSYSTLYAHANGLRVAEGQGVSQGDVLGLVGSTGLVEDDTPQLHFEVRYNGTPQDPMAWLAP